VAKPKRKLTGAQKVEKKRRRQEYMTIFQAELWVIDHYHPGARLLRREPTSSAQGGKSVPGEMAEFTYDDVFAHRDEHVFSQLHLFAVDSWIVKYRITFPVSEEQRSRPAVQKLLASLAWKAEQAAPGDAERRRA
jgi:hypothetical protein